LIFFLKYIIQFFKKFPELTDVLKSISFIFQDPFIPEVTTLIFGNNSLEPDHFFSGVEDYNAQYKISNEEFSQLILRNFLASYTDFFNNIYSNKYYLSNRLITAKTYYKYRFF